MAKDSKGKKIIKIKYDDNGEVILSIKPAKKPHTCPYLEELRNDYYTKCMCSEYDTVQCARDV